LIKKIENDRIADSHLSLRWAERATPALRMGLPSYRLIDQGLLIAQPQNTG
jgi:hypothetical protein